MLKKRLSENPVSFLFFDKLTNHIRYNLTMTFTVYITDTPERDNKNKWRHKPNKIIKGVNGKPDIIEPPVLDWMALKKKCLDIIQKELKLKKNEVDEINITRRECDYATGNSLVSGVIFDEAVKNKIDKKVI